MTQLMSKRAGLTLPALAAPVLTALTALVAMAALAGCSGSTEQPPVPPTSTVPASAEGARMAYVSGDSAAGASIYTNKEGKGYVALSADGDSATTVLHVVNKTQGRRVPAGAFVSLAYERTADLPLRALTPASAAGNYQAVVGGKPALFTIAADGKITAGASDCKLEGKVDFNATYGGAVGLNLTVTACGMAAPGSYSGIAAAPEVKAPAALQLIGENGRTVLDVLAYQ